MAFDLVYNLFRADITFKVPLVLQPPVSPLLLKPLKYFSIKSLPGVKLELVAFLSLEMATKGLIPKVGWLVGFSITLFYSEDNSSQPASVFLFKPIQNHNRLFIVEGTFHIVEMCKSS